jgi:hypothetical protein
MHVVIDHKTLTSISRSRLSGLFFQQSLTLQDSLYTITASVIMRRKTTGADRITTSQDTRAFVSFVMRTAKTGNPYLAQAQLLFVVLFHSLLQFMD